MKPTTPSRPPTARTASRSTTPAATRTATPTRTAAKKTLKKDEFSTGKGSALRAKASAVTGASVSSTVATTAVGGNANPPLPARPVHSFDTATYLSIVGNPPTHRITQQQCDTLRAMGMEHGVIGLPKPTAPDYAAQMAGLQQELTILNANGIRTDTYYYFNWTKSGAAKSDAAVRDEMFKVLDGMKGQPVGTFWFDVEFNSKLNPSAGAAQNQRMMDTAYQAFQDWKQANPDSKLEFGVYTSEGAWADLVKGPNDAFATKYADLGVPLWQAYYPASYDPKNLSTGLDDLKKALGDGFGGWSVDAGNVAGWQYRAGEHDARQPGFNYGLDRNVWLQDPMQEPLPITAIPSGFRSDLPVTNQPLYDYLKQDLGKPFADRKFKSMQDLINAGASFSKLGINANDAYNYRWEDPWKLVHGLPLGVDQFSSQPIDPSPAPAPTPEPTPAPAPTPSPAPQPTPGTVNALDLLGLKRGAGTPEQIRELQDTLMSLGHLADIHGNAGYGTSFGPMTETALKSFQKASNVPQTGVVDRATVVALAAATNSPLGFDAHSPFAPAFGLSRGANAVGDRPGIKALQDALIAGGYAPASMKTQTGYGTNFGPITEAGLKAFQSDNGLPSTGVVDAATITALENPRARPAGFAAGVAVTYRDQLGLPTGPAYKDASGALRQDFDHGSVWVAADHTLNATVGTTPLFAPRKLGTATSLEEANANFLTQWGPTAYNDPVGSNDIPYGYEDCGPTSSVMVLSQLGMMPHPDAAGASAAIDAQRDRILGYDSTKSLGLSLLPANKGTVGYGLVQAGAVVTGLTNTVDAVNGALDRGHPVILGTNTTWAAWGQAQKAAGQYLNNGNPGGHFVVVMGRSANGNYLIGDPLSKGGPIEVTQAQLETALKGAWSNSNSLAEVARPD